MCVLIVKKKLQKWKVRAKYKTIKLILAVYTTGILRVDYS